MRFQYICGIVTVYRALALRLIPAHILLTRGSVHAKNIPSTFNSPSGQSAAVRSFSSNLQMSELIVEQEEVKSNPLLQDWNANEHGLPPFTVAKPSDFENALKLSMKQHIEELKGIASNPVPATFDNTIAAFDRSGSAYQQVSLMFDNLCSSNGVPELQAVELKMAGPVAAHHNQISSLPGLFDRINHVYEARMSSNLNPEQVRLVERFHLDFVRGGAKFSAEDQTRYAKITEQLAELCTVFTQNLLADESEITILLEKEEDLVGLPADLVASARQAAVERGHAENPSAHIITLSRSLVEPFITFSERRDLREKAWRLWTSRGELETSRDNLSTAKQILTLRVEQAKMHGYENYAEYATADTMAGTPAKVMELLERVWLPAKQSIDAERAELENFITTTAEDPAHVPRDAEGKIDIAPWDWRHIAEKVRQRNYNLDESEVKPYFALDKMIDAIFDCARELFGLQFVLRTDLPVYHPDVQTYEVRETGNDGQPGKLVAIFLHDNFARPHKKSGAWMSEYRVQSRNASSNGEHVVPIITNNNNFNKAGEGESTLLSFDDARTLFHEFGHGLHGMLSNVTYQRLAGTNVLRDFVELPSQLYEHWLSEPRVLKKHARHYQTGEPIPDALLDKMMKANNFGQGFATIEYTSCALVDVALHQRSTNMGALDIAEFEKQELDRLGMPAGMVMRHRPAHFAHLFAGSGYASAYYVYLWAEVLDADGFDAFKETGDCFDRSTAQRVRQYIYSSGNSLDPAEAYRSFRGRDPEIEPMLKKKGLLKV